MMLGRYERPVARFLDNALRDARVFYDIGASCGYYSRLALRAMNDGAVVAFEPDPTAAKALSRLPVTVVGVAVGREPGEEILFLQHGKSARLEGSAARLESAGASGGYSRIPVPVQTLDSFDFPAPDVVKIDVEGSELDVLEGGPRTISSARALVVE